MQLHKFSLLKSAKSSPQFPLFPYKRPMTKAGFFKKYEYAYDEYYDCYICPNNEVLEYSTTNREGYKEYKSKGYLCEKCPYVGRCTASKEKVKVITRHLWEEYMEKCEDIRHTLGMGELYKKRKAIRVPKKCIF